MRVMYIVGKREYDWLKKNLNFNVDSVLYLGYCFGLIIFVLSFIW